MEDLKQVFERMTPEERRNQRRIEPLGGTTGESLSMAEVQRLADKPIQRMLPSIVRQDLPVLSRMNLTIFTTDDDIGFVTSDNPCAWLDPERPRRPPSRSCPGPKTYLAIRPRLPFRLTRRIVFSRCGAMSTLLFDAIRSRPCGSPERLVERERLTSRRSGEKRNGSARAWISFQANQPPAADTRTVRASSIVSRRRTRGVRGTASRAARRLSQPVRSMKNGAERGASRRSDGRSHRRPANPDADRW
jgi:hypothetical protein